MEKEMSVLVFGILLLLCFIPSTTAKALSPNVQKFSKTNALGRLQKEPMTPPIHGSFVKHQNDPNIFPGIPSASPFGRDTKHNFGRAPETTKTNPGTSSSYINFDHPTAQHTETTGTDNDGFVVGGFLPKRPQTVNPGNFSHEPTSINDNSDQQSTGQDLAFANDFANDFEMKQKSNQTIPTDQKQDQAIDSPSLTADIQIASQPKHKPHKPLKPLQSDATPQALRDMTKTNEKKQMDRRSNAVTQFAVDSQKLSKNQTSAGTNEDVQKKDQSPSTNSNSYKIDQTNAQPSRFDSHTTKNCESNKKNKGCVEWTCANSIAVGNAYCDSMVKEDVARCNTNGSFARFHCCKSCAVALHAKSLDRDDPIILSLPCVEDPKCEQLIPGNWSRCVEDNIMTNCMKSCGICG